MVGGIIDSMDVSLSQALGDGGGPGSLVYCSPWSWKELDTTERPSLTYNECLLILFSVTLLTTPRWC